MPVVFTREAGKGRFRLRKFQGNPYLWTFEFSSSKEFAQASQVTWALKRVHDGHGTDLLQLTTSIIAF